VWLLQLHSQASFQPYSSHAGACAPTSAETIKHNSVDFNLAPQLSAHHNHRKPPTAARYAPLATTTNAPFQHPIALSLQMTGVAYLLEEGSALGLPCCVSCVYPCMCHVANVQFPLSSPLSSLTHAPTRHTRRSASATLVVAHAHLLRGCCSGHITAQHSHLMIYACHLGSSTTSLLSSPCRVAAPADLFERMSPGQLHNFSPLFALSCGSTSRPFRAHVTWAAPQLLSSLRLVVWQHQPTFSSALPLLS
jgi:hypothetical protein